MNIRNIVVGVAAAALCASAEPVGKSTPSGFTDDFEAAKAEAARSGRNVLAVFSGSDWCHWCKVLERNYLSKPEFVGVATNDFVLVFIDNPQDRSVLSETAKKNNEALTKKYEIRGFPTVKILSAKGEPITDCRPKSGATPKDYALQLRREVKVGPLLEKHLGAFEKEMNETMSAFFAEMSKAAQEIEKDKKGEEAEKAQFEAMKKMVADLLGKYRNLRERVKSAKIPSEIEIDRESLLKTLKSAIERMEESQKATWEEIKAAKAERTK